MKINPAGSLIAIIVSITCFTVAAEAQSHRIATASIPFEFHVGSKELPAGKYYFDRQPSTSNTSMLVVRNSEYKVVASTFLSFDHMSGRRLADVPSLIFADTGNTKVLAYLSDPGAQYLGRAGTAKWRTKASATPDGAATVISLKPLGKQ